MILKNLFYEKGSDAIANLSLFIFFLISFVHYQLKNDWFIISALSISTLTTFLFLNELKYRKLIHFQYGILDRNNAFAEVTGPVFLCFNMN